MKFWVVSLFATVIADTCVSGLDEQVSMLQAKNRVEIGNQNVIARVVMDFKSVQTEEETTRQKVDSLALKVKSIAQSWSQLPFNQRDALLRRASRSPDIKTLVHEYMLLPVGIKQQVIRIAYTSKAMSELMNSVPQEQKLTLVQELSNVAEMDDAVSDKTTTRVEDTPDGKRTVTETRNGDYYHRHVHGPKGTETTTETKNHKHEYNYQHNGQGGNARTSTRSEGGGHVHEHSTSHNLNRDGTTETNTETFSKAVDGSSHNHNHKHKHDDNDQTETVTNTVSELDDTPGAKRSTHHHDHTHHEQSGIGVTRSSNNRGWHHGDVSGR